MLTIVKENHWLWHTKLGHASWTSISKLQKNNLVRGLPSMSYKDDLLCEACQKGKQIKNSFSSKKKHCFHLKTFGVVTSWSVWPNRTTSTSEKRYELVIVDGYSRWTWVMFLAHKDEFLVSSLNSVKEFKMKREYALIQSKVFMGKNLRMKISNCSMKKIIFFIIFQC